MKAYIAAGWFSEEQEKSRQEILRACDIAKIHVYSPREECSLVDMCSKDSALSIFDSNIQAIPVCDFMIASTAGKDMGTLFECGYAYACRVPVIYYWPGGTGNFNLMLAQSGHDVCRTFEDLLKVLQSIHRNAYVSKRFFKGDQE